MDAIRIARAFTGRDTIVKIFGSYHGHHDYVMVSISVPYENIGDPDNYASLPYGAGIPKAASDLTIAVPFNDAGAMERRIERLFEEGRPPACVIMEPAMMNLGVVLPEPGYLEAVRDITRRHGVVLIFDEVKTGLCVAPGGATEKSRRPCVRVKPPGAPSNGRAITRPTASSPDITARTAAHALYSSSGGTTST